MKFNVQKATNFLLNEDNSVPRRAIKLFELMIALHFRKATKRITLKNGKLQVHLRTRIKQGKPPMTGPLPNKTNQHDTDLHISIFKKQIVNARLLMMSKILDHIETEWRTQNDNGTPTLRQLAKIPQFCDLYDEVFLAQGGWRRIRYVESARLLNDRLDNNESRINQAAGEIIDHALRYRGKRKRLLNESLHMVATSAERRTEIRNPKTLRRFFHSKYPAAPFLYLLQKRRTEFDIGLQNITGSSVARRYLDMAADIHDLRVWFQRYNEIAELLNNRGFSYKLLDLPEPAIVLEPLKFKALTDEEQSIA